MGDREVDRETIARRRSVIEIERRVLGALCRSGSEAALRECARKLLADYRWSDAAHQAVFEIMMNFPCAGTEAFREQIPARLTRRGFPDFDFDRLFDAPTAKASEAEKWMRELVRRR